MQIKYQVGLILSISIAITGNAFAINKDHPFYMDGELGWTNIASDHVDPYHFKDKKQFGYRLSMGYLFTINCMLNVGTELGYGYYGKTSYTNVAGLISNYTLDAWDLLVNLNYKPADVVNIYLKGGIADASQRLVIVGPNVTPGGFYQQRVKPMAVLAASYNVTNQVEFGISYTHIFAEKAPLTSSQQFTFTNVNQVASVDAVMLGLSYAV